MVDGRWVGGTLVGWLLFDCQWVGGALVGGLVVGGLVGRWRTYRGVGGLLLVVGDL